jgi:hypothetical protein
MKHETYREEPGLGGYFPGREKQGRFSRSPTGLRRPGKGHALPIPVLEHEKVIVHEQCGLSAMLPLDFGIDRTGLRVAK